MCVNLNIGPLVAEVVRDHIATLTYLERVERADEQRVKEHAEGTRFGVRM